MSERDEVRKRMVQSIRRRVHKVVPKYLVKFTFEGLTGRSEDQFVDYVESKFQPGFTWGNYGSRWLLNMERPESPIESVESIREAFRHDRFRPVSVEDVPGWTRGRKEFVPGGITLTPRK